MARKDFTEDNKKADFTNFPKLKLAQGETARIIWIEQPWSSFTHELRAPKFLNGKAVMKEVETKSGERFQANDMDFIARYLCLGDQDTLDATGIDRKNCPMCDAAASGKEIAPAVERYATNVLRYKTTPDGRKVQDPFAVEVLVFPFTQFKWDKVYDISKDLKEEGLSLTDHDLLFGPCTNAMFQQFEISASVGKAEYQKSKDREKIMRDTYENNKADDETLASFCGRNATRAQVESSIEQVKDRWALVNGATARAEARASGASLSAGLAELDPDPNVSAILDETDGLKDIVVDKPNSGGEKVGFDDLLAEFAE